MIHFLLGLNGRDGKPATPFAVLPSEPTGDRGLIGIAFDPGFGVSNHYVYFYYTGLDLHNRLVRFDASGDVGTDGPFEIFKTESLSQHLHVGGSIAFGPDGKMYFAVGDNGYSSNAQILSNPHGTATGGPVYRGSGRPGPRSGSSAGAGSSASTCSSAAPPLAALLNAVLWATTILWFLDRAPIMEEIFVPPFYYLGVICLVFGNATVIYLNVLSARTMDRPDLLGTALLSPGYWAMMSLAGTKAAWQLVFKPSYWEKTTHGLHLPKEAVDVG